MWNMVAVAKPAAAATVALPKGKKKAAASATSSSASAVPPASVRAAAQAWAPLLERAAAGLCLSHELLWTDIVAMEELARALGARMAK